jgi:ABC-2 type transport system ATP-binding protein
VEPAIRVDKLVKTYRTPFRRRRVEALCGVSFTVEPGQIFGFVGPNGAGKTTTIRTLMGLIRPTGGSATILGRPIRDRVARYRVGFLPESPYFYDYLTVGELCDLTGRLFGIAAADRKKRADALIDRVGLGRATTQSLKKFSKGMLQRAGLAQALMNDPDVVVLDEPMSGLDPIGRKEVRDLILELRERGKTVLFSTHILSDVEALADRVAIIARGVLQAEGRPHELVGRTILGIEVTLRVPKDAPGGAGPGAFEALLAPPVQRVRLVPGEAELIAMLPPDADVDAWLAKARELGAHTVAVTPRHETLEDMFLRQIARVDGPASAREGRT